MIYREENGYGKMISVPHFGNRFAVWLARFLGNVKG